MAVQDVYRALSDPERRKILKLLQDGPLPAGAIAAEFEISLSLIHISEPTRPY